MIKIKKRQEIMETKFNPTQWKSVKVGFCLFVEIKNINTLSLKISSTFIPLFLWEIPDMGNC